MGTFQEMIALTWPENVAKTSNNNMLSVLRSASPDLVCPLPYLVLTCALLTAQAIVACFLFTLMMSL